MKKAVPVFIAPAVLVLVAFLAACTVPETVLQGTVGVDAVPPRFVSIRTPASDTLSLVFSEPVKVKSTRFDPDLTVNETIDSSNEVTLVFSAKTDPGHRYLADISVEDLDGNTLSVLVPFYGRNENPPKLVINEIRTEYSKPRVEYIELFVLEAGLLGGLSLATASSGFDEGLFVFPPVKVQKDDYIVVHLRSIEEGLVNETASTSASAGTDSSLARDFWLPGAEKRIRKSDVVAILDSDGQILDAAAFCESPDSGFKSEELQAAFDYLVEKGAWEGNPVSSLGTTATRTLCRNARSTDTDTEKDWFIVDTGKASPGIQNKENVYVPKNSVVR